MTARFYFGTNGKRLFDDSHVIWCQTLNNIFFEALAFLLTPFITHVVSFLATIIAHCKVPYRFISQIDV